MLILFGVFIVAVVLKKLLPEDKPVHASASIMTLGSCGCTYLVDDNITNHPKLIDMCDRCKRMERDFEKIVRRNKRGRK